jgi:hypothetical protein
MLATGTPGHRGVLWVAGPVAEMSQQVAYLGGFPAEGGLADDEFGHRPAGHIGVAEVPGEGPLAGGLLRSRRLADMLTLLLLHPDAEYTLGFF